MRQVIIFKVCLVDKTKKWRKQKNRSFFTNIEQLLSFQGGQGWACENGINAPRSVHVCEWFFKVFFSKKKKTYQNGFCFFISDAGMAGSGGVILLIVQCTDNRSDLFTVQIIVVVLLKSNSWFWKKKKQIQILHTQTGQTKLRVLVAIQLHTRIPVRMDKIVGYNATTVRESIGDHSRVRCACSRQPFVAYGLSRNHVSSIYNCNS